MEWFLIGCEPEEMLYPGKLPPSLSCGAHMLAVCSLQPCFCYTLVVSMGWRRSWSTPGDDTSPSPFSQGTEIPSSFQITVSISFESSGTAQGLWACWRFGHMGRTQVLESRCAVLESPQHLVNLGWSVHFGTYELERWGQVEEMTLLSWELHKQGSQASR